MTVRRQARCLQQFRYFAAPFRSHPRPLQLCFSERCTLKGGTGGLHTTSRISLPGGPMVGPLRNLAS
jgi:hypothetical protein